MIYAATSRYSQNYTHAPTGEHIFCITSINALKTKQVMNCKNMRRPKLKSLTKTKLIVKTQQHHIINLKIINKPKNN